MRIAVLDDEQEWRQKVGDYLEQNRTDEFDVYAEGKALLASHRRYDLIFLDIELNGENGFDIATEYCRIYPQTLIVILTTHRELSRQGYQINAFRYIDKLFLYEIDEVLDSAQQRIRDFKRFDVEIIGSGARQVSCTDIYYFEAQKHKVRMCSVYGDFDCKNGISFYTEKFSRDGFYLVHRAYLVNLRHVREIYPGEVIMENGDSLCLSRRRYTEFRKVFMKWKLSWGNG